MCKFTVFSKVFLFAFNVYIFHIVNALLVAAGKMGVFNEGKLGNLKRSISYCEKRLFPRPHVSHLSRQSACFVSEVGTFLGYVGHLAEGVGQLVKKYGKC